MDKRPGNKGFGISLAIVFFVGVALGGLIQVGALCFVADRAALGSYVPALVPALVSALERTTLERNRLLEHLADVESNAACAPRLTWSCPAPEVQP